MLLMVIEHFKSGDPKPIRERFVRDGRMMPESVVYHASWVDPVSARCFQVMEAEDVHLLDAWIKCWADVIDFDIVPVMILSSIGPGLAKVADSGEGIHELTAASELR